MNNIDMSFTKILLIVVDFRAAGMAVVLLRETSEGEGKVFQGKVKNGLKWGELGWIRRMARKMLATS